MRDSQTVIARCRELAQISEVSGSTFRRFLSPAMKRCYEVAGEWMKEAGLSVTVDAAGNLRGLRPGAQLGTRVFLMGSHLDTVRNAGAFDGILGAIMAIAVVEKLSNSALPFDVEVVGFSEEEGVRFNLPFIGSRALVGTLDEQSINLISPALIEFGLDPTLIPEAKLKTTPLGFLEFHIEQGPVLDHANESVGLVEAIAGQTRATVKFEGKSNHAGTTPMDVRSDALAAAAQWIQGVEELARSIDGLVATNGKIECHPNVANVVPSEVTVSLDIRHANNGTRETACVILRSRAVRVADSRQIKLTWTETLNQSSVPMDQSLTRRLEASAPHGIRRMVSGAGHDAMILAPHIPSAMLFLRSPGGVSHHPAETVLPADVEIALSIGQRFMESLIAEYQ